MYGVDFINQVMENLGQPVEYIFNISRMDGREGNEFANPPVRVIIDFSTDFTNPDMQDTVTRHSIYNRKVDIYYYPKNKIVNIVKKEVEGEQKDIEEITWERLEPVLIGSFNFNVIDSPWDAFPILTQQPLALKALIEVCTSYHLKNLFPSQN